MNFILKNILIGCAAFAGISVVARIPILGWFGWLFALGVWVWLASRIVYSGKDKLLRSPNPSIPAMGWSALVGFLSGFTGALVSLILTTPAGKSPS